MVVDQLTAGLKSLALDMEQVAIKLAQLDIVGATDPDRAKSAGLALATVAAGIARDAALICSRLENEDSPREPSN